MRFPSTSPLRFLDHRLFTIFWLLVLLAAPALGTGLERAEVVGLGTQCLDVRGGSTAEGADVILFRCHGGPNQRWDLPVRGFTGEIVGVGGQCLDIRGMVRDRARVEMRTCDGSPTQQWRFGQDGRIVSAEGPCLDVLGSDTIDGARVVVFECHGKANQRWRPRVENRFTILDLGQSGGLTRLWIDPIRPNVFLANTPQSGIVRSEDEGESWSALYDAPGLGHARLVTVSQVDGDFLVAQLLGGEGVRYRRSVDGGQSWGDVRFPTGSISEPVAGAQRSRQVFVLGENGKVYRSMDAGEHWSRIGRLPSIAASSNGGFLFTHPGRPKTVFASTLFEPWRHQPTYFGLFISIDGGRQWRMVISDVLVTKMQVDPHDSRWVYARTTDGVLLRSANGGSSWVDVSPFGDHFFELDFVVDQADPRRIVAASATTLFTSDDRGDSWSSARLDLPGSGYFIPLGSSSAERWFGAFQSYDSAVRSAFYASDDLGRTWKPFGRGLAQVDLASVAVGRASSGRVYSHGPSGLFASADGGTTWRRLRAASQTALAVDPADARHILTADQNAGLLSSRDGGRSFVPSFEGLFVSSISRVLFRPRASASVLVLGTCPNEESCVFRSNDGGARWQEILGGAGYPLDLDVDADGAQWYLLTGLGFHVSADGGDTWQTQPLIPELLAPDRAVAGRLWAADRDGLLLSQDRGASWRQVDLPSTTSTGFSPFLVSLDAAFGVVYAGLGNGEIWRSADDGATWTLLQAGLPPEVGGFLAADPLHPGRLWLTRFGLGVFVGDFSD